MKTDGLWWALLAFLLVAAPGLAQTPERAPPVYGFKVVRAYPHDPGAFTEGLFYQDGALFESTGLEGRSSIRREDLETGRVVLEREIAPRYFGEGIVAWNGRLIELTWRSHIGFVYGLTDFDPVGSFHYPGEGWALTHDDRRLIMSDGTADLRFLNPDTLEETGRLHVTDQGRPIAHLNELEWVKGEIYANIWLTDLIARIDPKSGHVVGWIDLTGLSSEKERFGDNVLNGIAYDADHDRLFVTGKLWPHIYEIRLVRREPR